MVQADHCRSFQVLLSKPVGNSRLLREPIGSQVKVNWEPSEVKVNCHWDSSVTDTEWNILARSIMAK